MVQTGGASTALVKSPDGVALKTRSRHDAVVPRRSILVVDLVVRAIFSDTKELVSSRSDSISLYTGLVPTHE
eukprot:scaffold20579_cov184-Skeletonema_marinoi.AAC.5